MEWPLGRQRGLREPGELGRPLECRHETWFWASHRPRFACERLGVRRCGGRVACRRPRSSASAPDAAPSCLCARRAFLRVLVWSSIEDLTPPVAGEGSRSAPERAPAGTNGRRLPIPAPSTIGLTLDRRGLGVTRASAAADARHDVRARSRRRRPDVPEHEARCWRARLRGLVGGREVERLLDRGGKVRGFARAPVVKKENARGLAGHVVVNRDDVHAARAEGLEHLL